MSASRTIRYLESAARIAVVFEPNEPECPALREALGLAMEADDSEVHVLHAESPDDGAFPPERGSSVRDLLERWCAGSIPRVVNHFRPGGLLSTLPRLASEIGATVVVLPHGALDGAAGRSLREKLRAHGHAVLVARTAFPRPAGSARRGGLPHPGRIATAHAQADSG
jgi:hypothetical protein